MTPIEYLRQFKILDFAIFDLVLSFLGIYFLAPLLSKMALKIGLNIPMSTWLYWTLPIGVLAHLLTGNMTPMTEQILNPSGDYLIKLLILALLVLGIMGITKVGSN